MTTDFSWLSRTELLIGKEALEQLARSHIMVVGMGGVGSFAAEFIARAGVGKMTIIDGDLVEKSNRNRQLPALTSTEGIPKVLLMAERIKDINPEIELIAIQQFITPENVDGLFSEKFDYVVDAIDSVTPKLTFLKTAYHRNIPIVSCMGAGGRLDPTRIQVADISKTHHCYFAQQVRKMLKKEKIYKGISAVFSDEMPDKESLILTDGSNYKKSAYGTISYLPATIGAVAASVCLRGILGLEV